MNRCFAFRLVIRVFVFVVFVTQKAFNGECLKQKGKFRSLRVGTWALYNSIIKIFIFQQDYAYCHTSKGSKTWPKINKIKFLPWQSNSPDLNSMEKIWVLMKKYLQDVASKDKNELVESLKSVCANFSKCDCQTFVNSMPNRIRDIIKAKADATKY